MSSNKRLMKEYASVTSEPPAGCSVKLAKEDDLLVWDVVMDGPEKSPYESGKFHLQLTFPENFPFKPPVLSFRTKIWHPNVTNDGRGSMCLGILKSDEWKPATKVAGILDLVHATLVEPQPDDAVEGLIAEQYKNHREEFDAKARQWTKEYAK